MHFRAMFLYGYEQHISLINSGPLIVTLVIIWPVFSSDGFLGIEIDDKLSGTLALGESVVVTGLNGVFSLSNGALVTTKGTK